MSSILRPFALVFLILAPFVHPLRAQTSDSLNTFPEPPHGVTKLGVEFFKINFTPSQRAILDHVELELLFIVDAAGKAYLEDVNGITDRAIIDSLQRKADQLPPFRPALAQGRPVEGVFSMLLQYPIYKKSRDGYSDLPRTYRKLTREDLVDFELGGRMDALIGGAFNGFTGTAHEYLRSGGGMKIDLSFSGKGGYGGGITMSFYGNRRKKDYPIDPSRVQEKESLSLMLGLTLNKTLNRTDRTSWLVQFEPCYARQNISAKINNQDKNDVYFQGFSPGVTLHYNIRIGKEHFTASYMQPALFGHYVNFHAGIRPLFYNSSAGSGIMFEAGISYRMVYHFFESYTLKD